MKLTNLENIVFKTINILHHKNINLNIYQVSKIFDMPYSNLYRLLNRLKDKQYIKLSKNKDNKVLIKSLKKDFYKIEIERHIEKINSLQSSENILLNYLKEKGIIR